MRQSDSQAVNSEATTLERARDLIARGQSQTAKSLIRDFVVAQPNDPRGWQLLSLLDLQDGRVREATLDLERAVSCAPRDPSYLVAYGQLLANVGRRADALEIVERVLSLGIAQAEIDDALGTLFTYCDEPHRASTCFERATAAAPANPGYLYNLATAQRMTGRLREAELNLNRVITLRPQDWDAYHTRADLRTQTDEDNHVEELQRLLSRPLADAQGESVLCYALSKELEDLGHYADSFRSLRRANFLQRGRLLYDVGQDTATMDRIIETHTAAAIAHAPPGFETDRCIFIIGLPRTGTTLVERILSSHSAVSAAGELRTFAARTVEAVQAQSRGPVTKFDFVTRALDVDPRALGRDYLTAASPRTTRSVRFTDKMPMNYLYAGLIGRALPGARIIAVRRNPMDSCYAIYKTLFKGAYPFSYDLLDLGRYYAAWDRLMRHWQAILGDKLLTVRYESLVADQERVSRQIISHCGLRWEDACLTFHEQLSGVTTASTTQVRHPIYVSSVGKWRHYADELVPLVDALRTNGITFSGHPGCELLSQERSYFPAQK
jgi:tetratricopeptide (TPR) repeat protein